jgi:aminoglycoside phosphotransferase (APT) family kinase protein
MSDRSDQPSREALGAVRRLAGGDAVIRTVTRLHGGQHADTWKVDTDNPGSTVVVRQFPAGDSGAAAEHEALRALGGLDGLAPVLLDGDVDARWSNQPTSLISWLDGCADITPADPEPWADELGRALAVVHAVPPSRLTGLPSVFDQRGGDQDALRGPLAPSVRSRWARIVSSPEVLAHSDYWSGNVVWRDQRIVGIVDWSGAARGPRGFDLGWCRLDLVLLFDERIADIFRSAYEAAARRPVADIALWDSWAAARSHDSVTTWGPNYSPLGRPDLDARALRTRHMWWTEHLLSEFATGEDGWHR